MKNLKISNMQDEYKFLQQRDKLMAKFSHFDFQRTVYQLLDGKITKATELLNKEYEAYFESSKKGLSYKDRKPMCDRIESLKKYIEIKKEEKKKVIPKLSEFLLEGDYEKMLRMGFTKFINLYYL